MSQPIRAVVLDIDDYKARGGNSRQVSMKMNFEIPFEIDTSNKAVDGYTPDPDDVIVRGPVYVGNADMLDRHSELVAPEAILNAWGNYSKNPVILYNHSKDAGVIGRMLDVEMGMWDGIEGEVPIGRALIDGGEKAIVRKIRKGMLRAFSIGFIAKAAIKECADEDSCYLTFTDIDWLETSVVDVPASPNALFQVEKHIIGYEDLGDSFAIVFEKEYSDDEDIADEDDDDDMVVEESVGCGGCGTCNCGSKVIEADTEQDLAIDESTTISELKDLISSLNDRLDAISPISEPQSSKSECTESLNTPIDEDIGYTAKANTMTDETIIETAEQESLVVVEDSITTPELEIKTVEESTEEVVVKATEEATEEAEELPAEELPAEVVEEVAEATEEESAPSDPTTTAILIEVVKALTGVEARLSTIESHVAVDDEINSLKAQLEALKTEKDAAIAEAALEAEVSKRVAALVGEVPAAELSANPKSIGGATVPKVNKSITRHDPQPVVSHGMNGLASWLENQISSRGA